ncbi:MAG: glycosyltransferase family 4 protein [Candidatus Kaistia colombiensis]|nr:MAG: glycosyltransferase family 4 protein [Kaistia sp.]
MRIALLTELYPPSIGGQELFFEGLGRALAGRGHRVEVFCIGHAAELPAREIVDGVTVHRFPSDPAYRTPPKAWMKRAWPTIFRYAFWTRRRIRDGDYDLVVLNQWPLLHVVTLPARLRRRAVLHWCEVRDGRFYAAVQRWLPGLAAHNTAISDAVASAIGELSGRPFFTMPSGLRLEDYRSAPRGARSGILSLGRVVEHKNLPLLVATYERLKQRGYAGRLTIAGDGPAMAELRRVVAASPVADDIAIAGPVSDGEKAQLLAKHELFAIVSRREGFPRVVAEAMASGLPVLTAAYPGNGTQDIVLAAGCGLVAAPEPAVLADGVRAILDQWEGYSDAGRRFAQSLDWTRIAERLERQIGWEPTRSPVPPEAAPSHATG